MLVSPATVLIIASAQLPSPAQSLTLVSAERPAAHTRQVMSEAPTYLNALRNEGERRFLGLGGSPRLIPIAPFNPEGEPIVFIHGFTGDPANQEVMVRAAHARGMQVWTMAYDTVGVGAEVNAAGFAREFERVWGQQKRLTVVAHSLGALTFKAAMDRIASPDGHVLAFETLHLVSIATPWGGIDLARPATHMLENDPKLAFARALAPTSTFVTGLSRRPLASPIQLVDIAGDRDPLTLLPQSKRARKNRATLLAQAARRITVPGTSHNTVLWAPITIAFALDPDHSLDPGEFRHDPLLRTIIEETAAILGVDGAFRGSEKRVRP